MIATLVYCASATSWLTSHLIQAVQSLFPEELTPCAANPVWAPTPTSPVFFPPTPTSLAQPSFAPLRNIQIITLIVMLSLAFGVIAGTRISPSGRPSPSSPTQVDDIPAPLQTQNPISVLSPNRPSTLSNPNTVNNVPALPKDQNSVLAPPPSVNRSPNDSVGSSRQGFATHRHFHSRDKLGVTSHPPPSWLTPSLLVILIILVSYLIFAIPVIVHRELDMRQRPMEASVQGALLECRRSSEELRLSLQSTEAMGSAAETKAQLLEEKHELLADRFKLLEANYGLLKENHKAQREGQRSQEAEFRRWWEEVRRSQETEFRSWREEVQRSWHEEPLRTFSKHEELPKDAPGSAQGVSLEDVKRLLAQDAQLRQTQDAVKGAAQEAKRLADEETQRQYTNQRVRSVSESLAKAEKQRRKAAAAHVCATKRWWAKFVIRFRPLLVVVALECIVMLLIPRVSPLVKMVGFRIVDRVLDLSVPARSCLFIWIFSLPSFNLACCLVHPPLRLYTTTICLYEGLIPLAYSYLLRPIIDLNPLATIIKTYLVAMALKDILVVFGLFALCRGYHYLTWKPSVLNRVTALATEINRIREGISNGQDVNARPNVAPPSYFEALDAGAVDEWSAALVAGL